MTTYLDIVHLETYAAACAARSGIKVQWDIEGSVPRTNGFVIYLPAINSKSSDEVLARYRYLIKHESNHCQYTDFEWYAIKGTKGLLQLIINLLEDHRIDHANDEVYIGDRKVSSDFYVLHSQDISKRLTDKDKKLSADQLLTLPLFVWDAYVRKHPFNASVVADELRAALDSDGVTRLALLEEFTPRLIAMRDEAPETHDPQVLMTLAEDILSKVFKQDPKNYQEDGSKGKGKGKGKGEGDSEPSEDEGDGEAQDGEGKGDGISDSDDIITVEHLLKKMSDHVGSSRHGIHLEHTVSEGRGYSIPSAKDYHVIRWPLTSTPRYRSRSGTINHSLIDECLQNYAKPVSNKLRIKLQVRAQGRYEFGKKRGHLHSGSLHRIVSGKGTATETKVFKKHITSDVLDTAVLVLTDCSGSMAGKKFDMAVATALTVSSALTPLHISHAMLGFTNHPSDEEPVVFMFKEWEQRVNDKDIRDRFAVAEGCLYDNSDGDAIAWAAHYLRGRAEHRKILIVLSDGSPSGRWKGGDIFAYTKQVIEDIQDKKEMEIYGVGILDNNVKMYYKNYSVINKAEDLPEAILSIIDKSV